MNHLQADNTNVISSLIFYAKLRKLLLNCIGIMRVSIINEIWLSSHKEEGTAQVSL